MREELKMMLVNKLMDSKGTIRDENVRGNNSGYLLFERCIISLFGSF